MDTTKPRNKRTVPIRFNEDESYKYKSLSHKSGKVQFLPKTIKLNKQQNERSIKDDDQQKNDNNFDHNEDEGSSQEYIQSSYMKTQEQEDQDNQADYYEDDEGNKDAYVEEYQDEEFEDMYRDSDKNLKFMHELKGTGNPYELTFKKETIEENQQEPFTYQQNQDYSLPKDASRKGFDDESSQSFQQVPFTPYSSMRHKNLQNNYHPNNPESFIEARQQLFRKYYDSLVNLHFLKCKTNKDIEEKHKENLYSLLVTQLQKNIFINGLKINLLKNKKSKTKTLTESKRNQSHYERQRIESSKGYMKLSDSKRILSNAHANFIQESEQGLSESRLDELQPKIVIFEQITYGIIKKKMFECFSLIISKSQTVFKPKNQSLRIEESHYQNSSNNQDFSDQEYENAAQQASIYRKSELESNKKSNKASSRERNFQIDNVKNAFSEKENKQVQKKSLKQSKKSKKQQEFYEFERSQDKQLEDEFFQENNSQEDEELTRMRELIEYIECLKKEGRETDQQLRRYFIKWKIYLLEQILEDYQRREEQGDPNNYEEYQDQENQGKDQNESDEDQNEEGENFQQEQQQQITNIYHNPNQSPQSHVESLTQRQKLEESSRHKNRQPSRKDSKSKSSRGNIDKQPQQEDLIKQKKLILKSYLLENHIIHFLKGLSQNLGDHRLLLAVNKAREEKLKQKTFKSLVFNIQLKERQKAMDYYYEEIAQQQNLSQIKIAQLNHRTNLKAKYFFQLIKTCKNLKCIKMLDKLTLKFAFRKIKFLNDAKKKKQHQIQRHFSLLKSKTLFKSFQAWKNTTILSPSYQKLKILNESKDKFLVQQYFSVWQILYKQSLLKQRKAVNFDKSHKLSKVFQYLKFLSVETRQIHQKERQLKEYLTFSRGKQFYQRFYEFYGEKILDHRLNIKAQKLWLSRQKQKVYEKLQQWRNFIIKKQSYRAIEYRLVKLREKQTKGKVMEIWLNELDKRVNKKDELQQSAQHKDWLVKYYGSLCEIATSGKQTGGR